MDQDLLCLPRPASGLRHSRGPRRVGDRHFYFEESIIAMPASAYRGPATASAENT